MNPRPRSNRLARLMRRWRRARTVTATEMATQQATVRSVPATLLASVPSWNAYASAAFPDASARWRAPDGLVRTGHIYVPEGGTAGSTVPIWVTRSGQLASPPLGPEDPYLRRLG
jgi:hypothetical protein